jgi:cell division protein FtsN
VRLLSNIDAPGGTMLQIILAGQMDLDGLLARPELRQIQQRVSRRIRLEPLNKDELRSYIDHRLAVSRAAGSHMPGADELARALVEWEGAEGGGTFTTDAIDAIWRWSAGLPRVINLLCDRALEAAFAKKVRTIDGALVDGAALALGLRADAPIAASPAPAPAATPAGIWEAPDAEVPHALETVEPEAATPKRTKALAAIAAVLAVAAVVTWFMTRESPKPAAGPAATAVQRPSQPAAPAVAPSVAPAAAPPTAPALPPAPAAAPASAGQTAPAPERAPAASAPGSAGLRGASFEIVVASFRTEPRAATVAAQVTAAGLNVRRREVGGWQQVIAGPFPTREEADAAHQRLERAGLPGTQVVSTER